MIGKAIVKVSPSRQSQNQVPTVTTSTAESFWTREKMKCAADSPKFIISWVTMRDSRPELPESNTPNGRRATLLPTAWCTS